MAPEPRVVLEEALLVARLLFWSGRTSEADRMLRPLVREHPAEPELLRLWVHVKHAAGQLTETLRAVERLGTLVREEPSALHSLEVLHRISMQPDGEGRELELELVGDDTLARTHRAQVDLERAFRLAAQQKFTSAVTLCEAVAERTKAYDASLFKLALLEKALFLEGLGQFDAAIQTLERLGNTRGFEVDRDRLLCLARTYERRGTTDDLSRAQKVYTFLHEQTGAYEHLSRGARVAERRGDTAEAKALRRRLIAAFRRAQLELSLEELLRAACLRWVPLATLRTLVWPDEDLEGARRALGASDLRTHALLSALLGDREEASRAYAELLTSPAAHAVDAKYFANVREEEGDRPGGRALFLAALSQETAADPHVLAHLFAAKDDALEPLLLPMFAEHDKRARTWDALRHAAKGNQLAPEAWSTLARFEQLIGHTDEAAKHGAKAAALERVRLRARPLVGHVQVAAVYELGGRKRGMVHELWASRYRVGAGTMFREGGQLDESSIFGNVAHDMMRDIQNVFVAVRTFVEKKFPHLVEDLGEYRYVLKVTKDDEPSGGSSAGIAVALAFLSVFLQRAIPEDVAITGAVVADSSSEIRLHRVADVDHKMLGVHQRRLARLVMPEENRQDLEASDLVPREIWAGRVLFAKNLTQVMKLVFGDDVWEW